MRHKKSFNWYGMRQHFSIRKYHFGAASVLLGMSLAMGTGVQAVKAEEATASPDGATNTLVEVSKTAVSDATAASVESLASTTTDTVVPTAKRSATINYIVQYLLEDGTLVNAVVKSTTLTTAEVTAKASVEVVAELPEGYELAEGQEETSSYEVTEGAENLVVIKVVKKAEARVAPASTSLAIEAASVATTPVAEAKVVLEQVTSEAEVLATEAERLVVASDSDNAALKSAAATTKLTATEATAVLNDSVATLEAVNAQINAVRTNVEALALELRKFLGTEDIQVLLAATSTNLQNIGDGEGVLIETGTTATPDMSNPNGAAVTSKVSENLKATEVPDYLTIQYTPVAYFDAVAPNYTPFKEKGGQSTGGAYFRTSVKPTNLYGKLLVELVAKDGTVLETKEVEPNTAVNFEHFTTTHGAGYPFVYTYDPDYDSEDMFGVIRIQWANNTMSAVSQKLTRPITNTTVYKTEDGKQLATYTVLTSPDLNTTPSEKREFAGYTYKETTTTTSNVVLVPSEPFVEVTRFATNGVQFKTIVEAVGTDGTVKKTYYIADPNYTGTYSFTDASLDGFIPILETDNMPLGSTNANLKPFASLPETGYEVYWVDASTEKIYPNKEGDKQPTPIRGTLITDAAELDFSKLTTSTQWFHIKFNEKQDGTLAFIRFRPNTVGNPARVTFEYDIRDNDGATTETDLGSRTTSWKGMTHTISLNNNAQTVTETTHIYTPVPQEAIIRYQVQGAADYLEDSGTLTGNPGTDITYSTEDTINKYKKLGYELVSDNFTTEAGQDYDYDEKVKQEFLVVIKPRIVDVPKDVVPGKPVDPTDPNSPVWPDTLKDLKATQEVTRTVEYKYEDGTPVRVDAAGNVLPKGSTEGTPFVKTEKVTFTRPAQVNLVTGEITYGDWAADTTDTLKGNVLPEVSGYTASRTTLEGADAPMTETVKDKTVTATDADINEVVYYKENPKYGDVVVNYVNTDGKVIATPVVDTNDALVGTEYSTADRVPKKIVEDGTGDVYYYKEIKPEDAAKETGTVVEGTTEVTYVYEKAGNVVVHYELEDGTPLLEPVKDVENGKPGDKNDPADDYTTTDRIKETITTADGKVYKRVPEKTKGNETGDVEAGQTIDITYIYEEVKSDVIVEYYDTDGKPISGTETGGATSVVDIEDASVGTVYNTDDKKPAKITTEDGKVYYYKEVKSDSATPAGKVAETTTTVKYVYEPGGSVTISYVSKDGKEIKPPVKDEENEKPGKIYSTEDNKPETIQTADGKTYRLVPEETTGEENGTITSGEDKKVTYVYEEVKGKVVVKYVDANGNPISGTADKGVAGKEKEVASEVEDTPLSSTTNTGNGYDTTDNRPNTITAVDGTVYKLVPAATQGNETGDIVEGTTTITYVYVEVAKAKGSVVVRYVEAGNEANVLKSPVIDEDGVVVGTKYDTTDNKPTEIEKDGSRYVLVPSKTTVVEPSGNAGLENGDVTEGTTVVTYKYQKVANWIPQIPTTPENPTPVNPVIPYPFDPTNPDKPIDPTTPGTNGEVPSIPYVPGYVPVDPKTNDPLKPVEPTDPKKGYVPPTPDESGKDTPIPYVQTGNVVVNYVDENGKEIKKPVQDETNVPAGKSYDTTDHKPTEIIGEDGSRYVLIPSKTIGSETGTVEGGKTTEITYVYKKVSNWIPQIPATPENPTPVNPVIPYPFDPTNPDKPIDPTTPGTNGEVPSIPYVPGYTPVDPKDNTPLKPIDPTDPSKGYVPPTPDESGKDTPIPYVQNGNVVVNYVTEDGTPIKTPVNDETNAPAGKSYDTRDNKPTEIVTEDGSRYVLIPSKTIGSETGTIEGGKTTEITYVYKKVSNWIPQIPATPENPTPVNPVIPYPFDPNDPDKPIDPTTPGTNGEVPSIPYVPGYVPVDPKTNEPLKPVDPTDPKKGYVPPVPTTPGENTPIPYVPATPTKKVVTNHVDEETGLQIAPQEEGTTPNKSISGYEYVRTVVDADGNTTHIYRKKPTTPVTPVVPGEPVTPPVAPVVPGEPVTPPVAPVVPGEPVTPPVAPVVPGEPVAPATPVAPSTPVTPATPSVPATSAKSGAAQLPNTGESSTVAASALGVGLLVAALALAGKRRRNED